MKDVTSAKGLSELRTAITSRVHAKPARKGTAHLDLYLLSMEKQRLETELARLEQRRRHIHEHLAEINQAMSALEEEAKKERALDDAFTGSETRDKQPVLAAQNGERPWRKMPLDY